MNIYLDFVFLLMTYNIPGKTVNDRMLHFLLWYFRHCLLWYCFSVERNLGFTPRVKIKGKLVAPRSVLSCSLLTLEGSVCKDTKRTAQPALR